jgi:hypothetical protein
MREANIAGRNLLVGGMDVAAIPSNINRAATYLTHGIVPDVMPSWMPTSAGIDRFATSAGILDPRYTPQGSGENLLAQGARAAGSAAVMAGGPGLIGSGLRMGADAVGAIPGVGSTLAAPVAATASRLGAVPDLVSALRTTTAGTAGGLAAEGTRQGLEAGGVRPGNDPFGASVILPMLAGGVAGGFAPAGFDTAASRLIGSPYDRAMTRLGADPANNVPSLEDTGNDIRSLVTGATASPTVSTKLVTGLNGNQLRQVMAKSRTGEDVTNLILSSPSMTKSLAQAMPDVGDKLTAASVANDMWQNIPAGNKQVLVPDPRVRQAFDAQHGGAPSVNPTELGVATGVRAEVAGQAAGGIMSFLASHGIFHADPGLAAAIGIAVPYAAAKMQQLGLRVPEYNWAGAQMGAATATQPATANLTYQSVPGTTPFAPPSEGGPAGQRQNGNQ